MKLEQIKDPKLRQRLIEAMSETDRLVKDIRTQCPKIGKRIRQSSRPLMNKLEREYYDEYQLNREPHHYIQAIRFKLANGVWYKPDFVIFPTNGTGMICIEVKGPHAFRGGFENLKMAAHQYPLVKWILVWKEDGNWKEQVVLP